MFRRNQSTQAAAALPQKQPIQAYQMQDGGIHPATTADVGAEGKALDTDDLVIFLIMFGAVWTVAVVAYSLNQGWALGFAVIVWTAGGLVLGILLLFIQSRTWVQTWNSTLHFANERLRVRAQERVLTFYYECEVEKERIREESKQKITEIQERTRMEMSQYADRRIATMSAPNYIPAASLDSPKDEAKTRILCYLADLYYGGLNADGRIKKSVPWGTNSTVWPPGDKDEAARLFMLAANSRQAWVVRYDENRRGWYVNVEKWPDGPALVSAFAGVY